MVQDTERRFNALANRMKPKLKKAFIDAVRDIANTSRFNDLVRALERGDIELVVRLLGIEQEFYKPFENLLVDVFSEGGKYAVESLPKNDPATGDRFVIRFGIQDPVAQEWLRQKSSRLIVEITESQREAVREVAARGMSRGDNPQKTAIDIVGRYDRATGRRSGGIVGLTSRDALAVDRLRSRLLEEGKTASQAEKAAARYASKLLRLRGERIARTETIAALNAGRMDAMRQAVQSGKLDAQSITKIWIATKDGRTRDAHLLLNGKEARFNEPFQSPLTGSLMDYPGDNARGARGEDIINCRCSFRFKVDYIGAQRRREGL